MAQAKIEADWNLVMNFETDKQVEILIDRFDYSFVPENTVRIVVIQEPTHMLVSDVMKYIDYYTFVFTYHQEILDNNPKARLFLGMTTWVDPNQKYEKKFKVSTLVGGKTDSRFKGYSLRHELWDRQSEIKTPKDFYLSSACKYNKADYSKNLVLGDYKSVMFDCMFHIAIENVYLRNCFSEKIIDCFLTRTIPVYFGTPNIGDFFNELGIVIVNNVDQIITACNFLTPEFYNGLSYVIDENYNRALAYSSYDRLLHDAIVNVL
jgi:hypothetical protein